LNCHLVINFVEGFAVRFAHEKSLAGGREYPHLNGFSQNNCLVSAKAKLFFLFYPPAKAGGYR